MQTPVEPHVREEMLRSYASGHFPAQAIPALEEHILICESCRARLEEIDLFQAGAEAVNDLRKEEREVKGRLRRVSRIARGGVQ